MGFAVTTYSDGPIGIISARIISLDQTLNLPTKETQLEVDENRYQLFLTPSETIDSTLLSTFVDPINADKLTIFNNGSKTVWDSHEQLYSTESDALNALVTLYGAITDDDGVYSDRQAYSVLSFTVDSGNVDPTPPSASAAVGIAVTQHGSTVTGEVAFTFSSSPGSTQRMFVKNVTDSFITGIANTVYLAGIGYSGPNEIQYLGVGEIYNDIDVMHFFPNLEPPDPDIDNIFGNAVNKIVTSSNKGQGIANTFFPNGLNTTTSAPTPTHGSFVTVDTSIPKIGDVFTFNTSSASSNVVTINASRSNIKDLRIGVVSDPNSVGVSSYNAAAINIKNLKKQHAIQVWTGKRMRVVATEDKAGFEAAISILSDPAFQ